MLSRAMRQTWSIYDNWLSDPTVRYIEDPADVTSRFRAIGASSANTAGPKAVADCYLLALNGATGATLVTFDSALARLARKTGNNVVLLG